MRYVLIKFVTGAVVYAVNSSVTIRNCFFISNKALSTGRGSAVFSLNSSISIEYSVFYNHQSKGNGGVIYAGQNSNVAVQGSFFESNLCISSTTKLCGLCLLQSPYLQNVVRYVILFSGSVSDGEGGVIYFDGSQGSALSVTASNFWLASAVSAAGISLVGGRNNAVHNKIVASQFSGLAASTVGGSVLLKDSNLDMELSSFINNFAVSGASSLESYSSLVSLASNEFNFTGAPQLTLANSSNFSDSASFFDNGGSFCPLSFCTPTRIRNGQVIAPK